jgi:hypothetical protein
MKNKAFLLAFLSLFVFSCHRNQQIFMAKGNSCNYAGYKKWKVKITVKKDSTYQLITSEKSLLTNWKMQDNYESGRWLIENDTLLILSDMLATKFVLVDKKYLCKSIDITSRVSSNKEKMDFIKRYLSYRRRIF